MCVVDHDWSYLTIFRCDGSIYVLQGYVFYYLKLTSYSINKMWPISTSLEILKLLKIRFFTCVFGNGAIKQNC